MKSKLTKKEIIERLKKFGVEATLRPRKSTLLELLIEKVNNSTKEGCSGYYKPPPPKHDPVSPVLFMDDIHDYAMKHDKEYAKQYDSFYDEVMAECDPKKPEFGFAQLIACLLYTSPSPRDS